MSFLNNCHFDIFEKMAIFGNFQENMAILWQFLRKKTWQFSGNFLTVKWQFSGGSDGKSRVNAKF